MKPNMGTVDRTIRIVAGVAAVLAWPLGFLQGTVGIVALVVGIVLIATFDSKTRSKDSCRKGRNTLMSLQNIGTHQRGLNPITSVKLLKHLTILKDQFGHVAVKQKGFIVGISALIFRKQ